jgi:hypothetical protein
MAFQLWHLYSHISDTATSDSRDIETHSRRPLITNRPPPCPDYAPIAGSAVVVACPASRGRRRLPPPDKLKMLGILFTSDVTHRSVHQSEQSFALQSKYTKTASALCIHDLTLGCLIHGRRHGRVHSPLSRRSSSLQGDSGLSSSAPR